MQPLLDRIEIEQCLAQHARGIDRADEALLRGAYHDDGTVDYGAFGGSAAEFAAFLTPIQAAAPISLHRPSNIWCRLRGDQGLSESYVIAYVVMPTDGDPLPHLVGGRYLDRHSRRQGQWRMEHRQYVLDWIVQLPETPGAEQAPAFGLEGLVPAGGHYTQDPGNALLMAYAADRKTPREDNTMTEAEALDRVVSHQAIIELGCRYARGVDRGDPDTIMSAFHDDASIVSGAFNGPASEFAVEIGRILDATSAGVAHTVTNHWIEIDGDSAVGESYVMAYQGLLGDAPQDVLTGGRYVDRYERREGIWKITQRTFVVDWSTSAPGKNLLDSGMFEAMVKGKRGPDDPVYAFWRGVD